MYSLAPHYPPPPHICVRSANCLNAALCSAQHQSPTMIKIVITIADLALALPVAYASKLDSFQIDCSDSLQWFL